MLLRPNFGFTIKTKQFYQCVLLLFLIFVWLVLVNDKSIYMTIQWPLARARECMRTTVDDIRKEQLRWYGPYTTDGRWTEMDNTTKT